MDDEQLLRDLFAKKREQVCELAEFMPPEKAAHLLHLLYKSTDPKAKETLAAFFSGLKTEEQLQAVGKLLGSGGTIATMTALLKEAPDQQWKIRALLVGMSKQMFLEVLTAASPDHLKVLQHEALLEPLQHHLTLFAHEVEEALKTRDQELIALQGALHQIDPKKLTFDEIQKLLMRIEKLSRDIEGMLLLASRALSVAWNSSRPDLIDRLGKSKEALIRFRDEFIGRRSPPSGLWFALHQIGDTIFGSQDDPAIEALGHLGLMSLQDFKEVGLLEGKNLTPPKEDERAWHEALLKEMNEELKYLGLETVRNFREKHLFSKALLASYIAYKKASKSAKT